MKKIIAIIVFATLIIFSFGWAEIYKWVDEKGTVHFTEDPSTIPEKYREQAREYQIENEETRKKKTHEEITRQAIETWYRQQSLGKIDLMEKMVQDFPEISYVWTGEMSLWIKVPVAFTLTLQDLKICEEIGEAVARHYRQRKGHMVCVHIYYGKFKEVIKVCR